MRSNRTNFGRIRVQLILPNRNAVRWNREVTRGVISAISRGNREADATLKPSEIIAVSARRQRSKQAGDWEGRGVILVYGNQHDIVEELALIDLHVTVDPALLPGTVRKRIIRLT